MTSEERSKHINKFIEEHCLALLASKGAEYSRGEEDVNSNFKRVADCLGGAPLDPLTVAYIYASKHWDSITNYIKTRKTGTEPIEGRIADMVNYLFIISSLIAESQKPSHIIVKDLTAEETDRDTLTVFTTENGTLAIDKNRGIK